MTPSSTNELEQEAEQQRADMAETADRLRQRLTPGQLLDEVANTFRGGDWSTAFTNLKSQVRDNPLALALVGAGIACMAAGVPGRVPASGASRSAASDPYSDEPASSTYQDYPDEPSSSTHDGLRDFAENASHRAAAAGSAVKGSAASGAARVSGFARDAGNRTGDAVHAMEDKLAGVVHREPLVVGAVGLAIGAALGALLPKTRFEEEHLGPYEDRLKTSGTEAARGVARKARDAATAAGKAALDEADRQGLVPDDDATPLAQRVGQVADRAVGEARSEISKTGNSPSPSASDRQ